PVTLISVAYLASATLYSKLPQTSIGPDSSSVTTRPLIALVLPTAAALTWLLFGQLWRRDPIRDRDAASDATYDAVVFIVVLFVVGLHGIVLALLALGPGSSAIPLLGRTVVAWIGLMFMGVGNLLPRIRPNVVIGIRTSKAMADRAVWTRTNRVAG